MPSAAIPASPITLKKEGPNHYSGSITFPRKGDWTLELIVGITESSSVQVKGTVAAVFPDARYIHTGSYMTGYEIGRAHV